MGLFEFDIGKWICWRRHNTNPGLNIKYNQCYSRWISQSDCSIHIKLNYLSLLQIKLDTLLKEPPLLTFMNFAAKFSLVPTEK